MQTDSSQVAREMVRRPNMVGLVTTRQFGGTSESDWEGRQGGRMCRRGSSSVWYLP